MTYSPTAGCLNFCEGTRHGSASLYPFLKSSLSLFYEGLGCFVLLSGACSQVFATRWH